MAFDLADRPPVVRTPRWPLVAGAACAVLATLAAVAAAVAATDSLLVAVAGYVAGALVLPALTALHRFGRRSASKDPYFLPDPFLERVMVAALCLGVVAGAVNAWFVATEVAKR